MMDIDAAADAAALPSWGALKLEDQEDEGAGGWMGVCEVWGLCVWIERVGGAPIGLCPLHVTQHSPPLSLSPSVSPSLTHPPQP